MQIDKENTSWLSPLSHVSYQFKWCNHCSCFAIVCPACNNISCNGGVCEFCKEDVDSFYKNTRLQLNNYLTKDEMKVLEKDEYISELIFASAQSGYNQIDFQHLKGRLSKHSEELLSNLIKKELDS